MCSRVQKKNPHTKKKQKKQKKNKKKTHAFHANMRVQFIISIYITIIQSINAYCVSSNLKRR